jgi:hypothetical protein
MIASGCTSQAIFKSAVREWMSVKWFMYDERDVPKSPALVLHIGNLRLQKYSILLIYTARLCCTSYLIIYVLGDMLSC